MLQYDQNTVRSVPLGNLLALAGYRALSQDEVASIPISGIQTDPDAVRPHPIGCSTMISVSSAIVSYASSAFKPTWPASSLRSFHLHGIASMVMEGPQKKCRLTQNISLVAFLQTLVHQVYVLCEAHTIVWSAIQRALSILKW